jgi:hypothetical protein
MSNNTEITHDLIKSFKYTPKNAGEEIDASFVTLKEPNVNQLSSCAVLKQAFMRVIAKESGDAEETPEADTSSDDIPMETRIINALYASDVDMTVVLLTAKELFKEVALVDGEKKVTVPMLNSMSIDDIEVMTGKYMANFILVSVLKDQ